MLDSHPDLAIPPETHFLNPLIQASGRLRFNPKTAARTLVRDERRRWNDFGLTEEELVEAYKQIKPFNTTDAVRGFYFLYASKFGKHRWGDKTPDYIRKMKKLQNHIPEARFIHVIRDGRDAGLSQNSRLAKRGKDPIPGREMARRWRKRIIKARLDAEEVDHYMEVRYEDLVTDTEATLRRVCEHVELEFDPAMLRYYERAEERLQEMAGALPAKKGRPEREAGERIAAHALTMKPPAGGPRRGLEERDGPRRERRVRGGRRLPARRARLRDRDPEGGLGAAGGVGAVEDAGRAGPRRGRARTASARSAAREEPA